MAFAQLYRAEIVDLKNSMLDMIITSIRKADVTPLLVSVAKRMHAAISIFLFDLRFSAMKHT